jgi:hypothetical protein
MLVSMRHLVVVTSMQRERECWLLADYPFYVFSEVVQLKI